MKKKFSQSLKTQLNKCRNFIVLHLKTPEVSCIFTRYLNQILHLGLLYYSTSRGTSWSVVRRGCSLTGSAQLPEVPLGVVCCFTRGRTRCRCDPLAASLRPEYPFSGSSVDLMDLEGQLTLYHPSLRAFNEWHHLLCACRRLELEGTF